VISDDKVRFFFNFSYLCDSVSIQFLVMRSITLERSLVNNLLLKSLDEERFILGAN